MWCQGIFLIHDSFSSLYSINIKCEYCKANLPHHPCFGLLRLTTMSYEVATRSWSGGQYPTNTSVFRRFSPLIYGIRATNSWLWTIFVQCYTMSLSILLRSSKYHWKIFKTVSEKLVFWIISQCNRFRNGGNAQKILTSWPRISLQWSSGDQNADDVGKSPYNTHVHQPHLP